MVMQAAPALAQMGMIPEQGLNIPDVSMLYSDLLPHIGLRDKKRYLINLPKPQEAPGEGGVGSPPNVAGGATVATNNELVQRGSKGGI